MRIHEDDRRRAHGPRRESTDADVAGRTDQRGRRPTGPWGPADLLYLQRTAGNAAAAGLLAGDRSAALGGMGGRGDRWLQRVVVGEDPLVDLKRPEARGLIYGMNPARKTTSQRLYWQDQAEGLEGMRYRTIDAYNIALGISAAFFPDTGKPGATGVFRVREALAEADPVGAWTSHLDAETDPQGDDDLEEWVDALVEKRDHIGLYDLGDDTADSGTARIQAKHRLTKNLPMQSWVDETQLTPTSINQWLSADRTYKAAAAQFETTFASKTEQEHIAKWCTSAFFRRTSKLGIDFTTGRGHKIHLNLAADPTYDPSRAKHPDMRERGLEEIQDMDPDQAIGRAITSSEYRYVQKLIAAGGPKADLVNLYSERVDPPAAAAAGPAAGPGKKKRKWWNPLSWRR